MLDIYNYFNSKDIADHCRNIGHDFNPLEKTILIAMSNKSLALRLSAYVEIIEEFGDYQIDHPGKVWGTYETTTLKVFLSKAIETEEINGKEFRENSGDYYYQIEYSYPDCIRAEIAICNTYDEIEKEIEQQMAYYAEDAREDDNCKLEGCCINKYKNGLGQRDTRISFEILNVNNLPEVMYRSNTKKWYPKIIGEEEIENSFALYVPTPFKKGDILQYRNGSPIVLTDIIDQDNPYFYENRKIDTTDMLAYVYCEAGVFHGLKNSLGDWSEGGITADCCAPYTDLSYYRNDLTWKHLPLLFFSKYVKEDINNLELVAYMQQYREASRFIYHMEKNEFYENIEMVTLLRKWFDTFALEFEQRQTEREQWLIKKKESNAD